MLHSQYFIKQQVMRIKVIINYCLKGFSNSQNYHFDLRTFVWECFTVKTLEPRILNLFGTFF